VPWTVTVEIHTAIRPFLKIEDLLLPLPLPALMAILLVLGVIFLANRVAQRMRIIELQVVDCAACFILTTAILTASLHLLALLGLIFVSLLRVIGSLLAFIGLLQLLGFLRSLHNQGSSFWGLFREFSSWTRVAFILSAVILICLFFLCSVRQPMWTHLTIISEYRLIGYGMVQPILDLIGFTRGLLALAK